MSDNISISNKEGDDKMDINYKEKFNEKFGSRVEYFKNYVRFEKKEVAVAAISAIILGIISIGIYGYMRFSGGNEAVLSPLQMMFLAVAGKIKVNVVGQLDLFRSNIDMGIFIAVAANFLLLMIVNLVVYKRKYINSSRENIAASLKTGLYYALIMSIISVFSKLKVETGSDMMFSSVYISFGYTFISVFANSFIIAVLATMAANWKKEFNGENIYIDIFTGTVKFVLSILGISALIALVIIFLKPAVFAGSSVLGYPKVVSFAQIGAYIIMIASGGNIGISNGSISALNIFTGNINTDMRLFLMLSVSVIWIMLIVRGAKIKDKKSVMANAVIYAFMISIIARFASINMDISDIGIDIGIIETQMIYSISPISMFICSAIISFVMMYIGYMFSNPDEEINENDRAYDKKWKKYDNSEETHIYDVEYEEVK